MGEGNAAKQVDAALGNPAKGDVFYSKQRIRPRPAVKGKIPVAVFVQRHKGQRGICLLGNGQIGAVNFQFVQLMGAGTAERVISDHADESGPAPELGSLRQSVAGRSTHGPGKLQVPGTD